MTSYYLVQDDKGLFYIRRRILGMWGRFLGRTDETREIEPYWWPEHYLYLASFTTEAEAMARWEQVKQYPLNKDRSFKTLRKLS